jgi:hypothetical protein
MILISPNCEISRRSDMGTFKEREDLAQAMTILTLPNRTTVKFPGFELDSKQKAPLHVRADENNTRKPIDRSFCSETPE